MKMNGIGAAWLRENGACNEGRKWALSECASLAEVWRDARPDWLVWVATCTCPGVLDDKTLWIFACWVAEQALPIWYASHPDDHRPRVAIETRRRWIDGSATDGEMAAAQEAARAAEQEAALAAQAQWLRTNATPRFPDDMQW